MDRLLLQALIVHKEELIDPEIWLQASIFYAEIGEFETSSHIREVAVARKMRMDIGNSLIETRSHF